MTEKIKNEPVYLGDGVYYREDSYQCTICTGDGERICGAIFLDRHVAEELVLRLQKWLVGK